MCSRCSLQLRIKENQIIHCRLICHKYKQSHLSPSKIIKRARTTTFIPSCSSPCALHLSSPIAWWLRHFHLREVRWGIPSCIYIPKVACVYPAQNIARLFLGCLGHGVESAAVLEPLDLALVEGVRQLDVESLAAIGRVNNQGHGLVNSELSALEVDPVVGANLVVIGGVREGQRKHTLLLQVGLVLICVSGMNASMDI
jgi:hypothetical protein